jgi:hypothetical protein
VSDANRFIQSRRQTHLKVIDRCGLLPHEEQAEEFVEYAKATLADVERQGPVK